MWKFLVSLVDADKLAGWVRASVAAALTQYAGHVMGGIFASPEFVTALSVVVATIVVGLWSTLAKTLSQPDPIPVEVHGLKPEPIPVELHIENKP